MGKTLQSRLEDAYKAWRPGLLARLCEMGVSEDLAVDIVQEVFTDVLARGFWTDVRCHRSYLTGAVVQAARRHWRDRQRRDRRHSQVRQEWTNAAQRTYDVAEQAEVRRALSALMSRLPDRQRTVCALLMEGYDTGEIAARLGVARGTVRRHRQLARDALLGYLPEYPVLRSLLERDPPLR